MKEGHTGLGPDRGPILPVSPSHNSASVTLRHLAGYTMFVFFSLIIAFV